MSAAIDGAIHPAEVATTAATNLERNGARIIVFLKVPFRLGNRQLVIWVLEKCPEPKGAAALFGSAMSFYLTPPITTDEVKVKLEVFYIFIFKYCRED